MWATLLLEHRVSSAPALLARALAAYVQLAAGLSNTRVPLRRAPARSERIAAPISARFQQAFGEWRPVPVPCSPPPGRRCAPLVIYPLRKAQRLTAGGAGATDTE